MKRNYTIVFAVITALIALCAFWSCDSGGDDDTSPPSGFIGSAADLAKIGTSGYPLDGSYELTADITLPAGWAPIGSGTAPFTGTFDGRGYSITINSTTASSIAVRSFSSGVDISAAPDLEDFFNVSGGIIARGLFAYTENATIKDLNITISPGSSPVVITSTAGQVQLFGSVAAVALNTAFTNINISGGALDVNTTSTDTLLLGGIAGMLLEGSSIIGCSMTGDIEVSGSTDRALTGGLVGQNWGSIINSSVSGTVSISSTTAQGKTYAGGLAGRHNGIIENCSVTGAVRAEVPGNDDVHVGGIAGDMHGHGSTGQYVVIRKSYFAGTVSSTTTETDGDIRAGGIMGSAHVFVRITDCYSTGNVSATGPGEVNAGGIAGVLKLEDQVSGNHYEIKRCYASGDISAAGGSYYNSTVGGIAGHAEKQTGTGSITDCAALSDSVNYTGGSYGTAKRIVGYTDSSLANNIANSAMTGGTWTDKGLDKKDGADSTSSPPAQSEYGTPGLGWNFTSEWKWQGSRPVLKWQ